jgi:hypothetical protein
VSPETLLLLKFVIYGIAAVIFAWICLYPVSDALRDIRDELRRAREDKHAFYDSIINYLRGENER